jgi:hydroxymethylbilane synthase
LALVQARAVAERLGEAGHETEVVVITTSGDAGVRATEPGQAGKALWTQEIEDALAVGTIDLAVHSLKDLPADLPSGLTLGAVLTRQDPRDVLISRDRPVAPSDLDEGARVGTSSIRRAAALRSMRPDVNVVELKGNVPTRLRRLEAGDFDAIVLAAAGLNRLGRKPTGARALEPDEMCPALCQGIVGIEVRREDEAADWVRVLNDPQTLRAARAERALLRTLGVGCGAPVGGLAVVDGDELELRGVVWSHDGSREVEVSLRDDHSDPVSLGVRVGRALLDGAAADLLVELRDATAPRT